MKKTALTMMIAAALLMSLTGCGKAPAAASEAPQAEPQTEAAVTVAPAAEPGRQDGERFETVILLEGMEETVHYEHVRSETLGFEMDYDYESFVRQTEAGRECFLSCWDDAANPENYLELSCDTGNAELVASAIQAALSDEYDLIVETYPLDRAGSCILITLGLPMLVLFIPISDTLIAIVRRKLKGQGIMPQQLQVVYVIPAADGCRIARAHYALEAAEGFGRRFDSMLNTLTVIERSGERTLSDEQAISAIRNYCTAQNPDLAEIVNAGEYPVSWEVASGDGRQVVVLFRSYTGAEVRYYIDRVTGDAYVTEFVPGITPEEARTEESLNAWEYLT